MTALPQPARPMTIAEYAALPEDDQRRWELVEGNLLMSPSPRPGHMAAIARLDRQLASQVPVDFEAVPDLDIDLELNPPGEPGTSRRPDLVVVSRDGFRRAEETGALLRARDVVLVIEIISPGSQRMDRVVKRAEYADAGIPNYWIIDLAPHVSLLECHLAGGFGYQDSGEAVGRFETAAPFPIRIDLDRLV